MGQVPGLPAVTPRGSLSYLSTDHVLIPLVWRRTLSGVRVVFAVSFLVVAATERGWSESRYVVPAALYIAYSAATVVSGVLQRSSVALLHLLVDASMLLIAVHSTRSPSPWLGGLWFLYLMMWGLVAHQWKPVGVVAAGCVAFVAATRPPGWETLAVLWSCAGLQALFALWHKRRYEDRLYSVSRQAVLFRSEAIQAREDERERIAADFHDGPLQIFMSLQMRLEVARRLLQRNPETAKKELAEMAELWTSQVAELRGFLRAMRASEVDASELYATLSRAVEAFQKDTGISTAFSAPGSIELQQPGQAVEIVQVVREALHNVRKHAQATHMAIEVTAGSGWVEISLDDNGIGFPFAGAYTLEELDLLRMGPGSIKRRVRALGGDLTVESMPQRGATLRIRIPQ